VCVWVSESDRESRERERKILTIYLK
jgi:hypothetical protein